MIGDILSRAWKIIWKHKILWLFGVLASCGQSGGSSAGGSSGGSSGAQSLMMPMQRYADLGELESVVVLLIIAAGAIFVISMIMLMLALMAIGRVGLVRGVMQAEAGQEKLSFGELLSGVRPFFWRVVGLNVLVGLSMIALVLAAVMAFAIMTVVTLGLGLLLLVPLMLLSLPVMWAVVVVVEQANVALVAEDIGIIQALLRGWQVVKANPGDYLVMGLILIPGLGLLAFLVIGLPMLLVMSPFVIGAIINESLAIQTGTIASIVCFAAYLPFLIVLTGILRAYIISSWTLSYLRLAKPTPKLPVLEPALEPAPGPGPTAEPRSPTETVPDPLTGE